MIVPGGHSKSGVMGTGSDHLQEQIFTEKEKTTTRGKSPKIHPGEKLPAFYRGDWLTIKAKKGGYL